MLTDLFETVIPERPTIVSKHFQTNPSPMTEEYLKKIDDPAELTDATEFKSHFGKLQQQLPVRPDIAFTVNRLGTRNKAPGPNIKNKEALMQVVCYLYMTMNKGIFLPVGDKAGRGLITKLVGFSDAGGSIGSDSKHTYSTTFALVQVDKAATNETILQKIQATGKINSRTNKATTTDLAQTEAEIGAIVETTKDTIWSRNFMAELGQEQIEATPIYNDNKSGLHLVTLYDGAHKRVRYCLNRINFCLDQVKANIVQYLYLKSEELPADPGTKLYQGIEHTRKAEMQLGKVPSHLTPISENEEHSDDKNKSTN